ncbi:MAG: polysaccharide pyruvyl transferase family protein [Bacteroidota bacterium]
MAGSRRPHIALLNAVLGNGGDAAILFGIERAIREAIGPFDMTVFETQPEIMAPAYPELDVVEGLSSVAWPQIATGLLARARRAFRWAERPPRLRLAARAQRSGRDGLAAVVAGDGAHSLRALADVDAVVSTGGTYLVPAYWLGPRLLEFDLVRALGQPYALYTQSVGPYDERSPRARLRGIFEDARIVLLRDERSRRELDELAPAAKTAVRADAAFALADAGRLATATGRTWPAQPSVAVSVRDWPHFDDVTAEEGMARFRAAVAGAVERLVTAHSARVRFLSTCQGRLGYRYDDSAVALAIWESLPAGVRAHVEVDCQPHTPLEVRDAYACCDLVLATRMHAAILSLAGGTPVLPVTYEFKTDELAAALGISDWTANIATATPGSLADRVDHVIATVADRRQALFDGVDAMRANAMGAGALVVEALADRLRTAS